MARGPESNIENASVARSITHSNQTGINLGELERVLSTVSGAALTAYGLKQRRWDGLGIAALGVYLAFRGLTGRCYLYRAAGLSTASRDGEGGIRVDRSVFIHASPEKLYTYWRDLENLPEIMTHIEAVWMVGDNKWHWVAKAPAGMSVEWDAAMIAERENEMIAWRSLEGSGLQNEGSVRFEPDSSGEGTFVRVSLRYYPPGGLVGAWLAMLFGDEPNQTIAADLQNFKMRMEE